LISPEGRELVVVGRYALRTDAYDRALAVLAMEIAHWILREGDEYLLCVEPPHAAAVSAELEKFDAERDGTPRATPAPEKHSSRSLVAAAWVMALFFLGQNFAPPEWEDAGVSASDAVMRGEWWRVLTALTLHADFSHIGANIAACLVFATFLLPMFGTGCTWLSIVLTGAIGNWLNAWGHRGETHNSIGASTAVFGALGLLVGAQLVAHFIASRKLAAREILVPLGAGLGLLAFLGVGDEHTDFTAHFCGLIVGIPLGAMVSVLEVKKRIVPSIQIVLAVLAPALLLLAWMIAVSSAGFFS
jgi:membrane associated rhomboid family serine protease